jgi:hypothetical protein
MGCPYTEPPLDLLFLNNRKNRYRYLSGLVSEELLLSLRIHFSSKNNNL